MELVDYIKPELAVVSVVLYFLGVGIKKSGLTDCKYIPLINGAVGILICMLYVFATSSVEGGKDVALAIFTGLTQGVMVAGLSTYVHQMIKQMRGTGETKNEGNSSGKTNNDGNGEKSAVDGQEDVSDEIQKPQEK